MFDLKGKVALVTGGAGGIGLCIVKELLRNEVKGVALLDINPEKGAEALKQLSDEFSTDRFIYINTDVSKRSQFEEAFEQTITKFQTLDIVINNAGVVDEINFENCIAINLQATIIGSFLALDKYLPKTLGAREGIILNMASLFGVNVHEYCPVYTATKHGVVAFSRAISGPGRRRNLNVKVLAICPSFTTTPFLRWNPETMEEEFNMASRDVIKTWPFQKPEEVARHAVSMMRNAKNGSVWVVDGNISTDIEFPELYKVPDL